MSGFQPRSYSGQGDIKDLLNVISDLKTQLENRKQACTKLKTENQRLEKEKKSLEKELLTYQIGKGSTSKLGTSAAQRALQRAVKDQQRSLNATNMQAAKATQEAGDLQFRLDQMTEQCQTMEADIEALRQERDKAREEAEGLKDKIARQVYHGEQAQKASREAADQEAQEKLRESQRAMEGMRAEQELTAKRAVEEAEAAKKELEEARGRMSQQEQELSRATARIAALEKEPGEATGSPAVPMPPVSGGVTEAANEGNGSSAKGGPTAPERSNVIGDEALPVSDVEVSRQLGIQITRQAAHVEEALAQVSAASRAALSGLLSTMGGPDMEDVPEGIEALRKEASSRLQAAEAVIDLRLGNCASLIQERHAAARNGQQLLPEAVQVACAQQLEAMKHTINISIQNLEEQAHCALDSALFAAHGINPGKAQEIPYLQIHELCQALTETRARTGRVVQKQISAMQSLLQVKATCGTLPAQGCLKEAVESLISTWENAVAQAAEKVAAKMEASRQVVEDPAQASAASREVQSLVAQEALSLAALIHMHRSELMKASLSECQAASPHVIVSGMKSAIERIEASSKPWQNAVERTPPASSGSAQPWQTVSFKGRRSAAVASARWAGHITDVAADALMLIGSRGEAVEVILGNAKSTVLSMYSAAGSELQGIQSASSALAGTDEAEFESKAVISAVRQDVAEVFADAERRVMQVLMTPLATIQSKSPINAVSPARHTSAQKVQQDVIAANPRRGRDLSGDAAMSKDALEASRLLVSRSTLAKNLFLALDPKPYQGTTATQEQRNEEERNKKVLQWVRKVAAQLNWDVRNVKDIQRLADDGVDEEGLLDMFDIVLRLEGGGSGKSDASEIVEVLQLCGVPVEDIKLDVLDSPGQEAAFADQILKRAMEGRMTAPMPDGVVGRVYVKPEGRSKAQAAVQETSVAIKDAIKRLLSITANSAGTERAAAALEKATVEGVGSLERAVITSLEVSRDAPEPQSLMASQTLSAASVNQLSGIVLPAMPPSRTASRQGSRYAPSIASTVSEAAESGVAKDTARRTAFGDDDDDETLTQSFDTMTLRSNKGGI